MIVTLDKTRNCVSEDMQHQRSRIFFSLLCVRVSHTEIKYENKTIALMRRNQEAHQNERTTKKMRKSKHILILSLFILITRSKSKNKYFAISCSFGGFNNSD